MGVAIQLQADRTGRGPVESVTLLDGGREAFPRMLDAIESARHEIFLETYAFARDGVGEHFLDALGAAARRGVRVSVVLDGWGSLLDGRTIQAVLGAAGGEVRIYHPLLGLLVGRFGRDHRKILLVDGEVAFLGGINIGEEYGQAPGHVPPPSGGGAPAWLDLALEVRGPAAAWLARRVRGDRTPQPPGKVRIHLSGRGGGHKLRRRYLKAIGGAQHDIRVAQAYFIPDRRLVRSLTAAARRGIRVTLLLAGRSDVRFARTAAMRLYRQLLRSGVEIREWTSSVLHAKAALVDGTRFLVGSFNLDPFSLANLESLVELDDPEVGKAAAGWMEAHLAEARPVSIAEVEGRTPLQRWLLDTGGLAAARFAEWVGRLLRTR